VKELLKRPVDLRPDLLWRLALFGEEIPVLSRGEGSGPVARHLRNHALRSIHMGYPRSILTHCTGTREATAERQDRRRDFSEKSIHD